MPKITNIIYKEDRNKHWIYIDDKYVDSIHNSIFQTMGINVGTEISIADLKILSSYERITAIDFIDNKDVMKDRFQIYINNKKCASIRARIKPAMAIEVGTKITCKELIEFEKYVWKRLYGPASWEKEKIRINKVKNLIEKISNDLEVRVVGFGADSVEELKFHPNEAGSPDLSIINTLKSGETEILIEVTGTERMKDSHLNEYWIRPDKLEYIKQHPEKCIWVILYYSEPEEKFIFIKPEINSNYKGEIENIKGADEKYVKFNDKSIEKKSQEEFFQEIKNILL